MYCQKQDKIVSKGKTIYHFVMNQSFVTTAPTASFVTTAPMGPDRGIAGILFFLDASPGKCPALRG